MFCAAYLTRFCLEPVVNILNFPTYPLRSPLDEISLSYFYHRRGLSL